jgi:glycosyltransferase involved in cell wall biosynthesis
MRIGIDARFALRHPRRGIGTYSYHLLTSLVPLDQSVNYVIYTDRADADGVLPSSSNVQIRRLWPSAYPLWEQVAFPLALQRDELDLLHTLGNTSPFWLPTRTRLVITLHDVMFLKSGESIPVPKTAYQRAGRVYRALTAPINARQASAVITISEFSRQDILQSISGLDEAKVIPIFESCDPRFTPRSQTSASNIERPFLLCLGAEDPRKNTFRIVQSYLHAVRNHGVEHDLVICGYANWMGSSVHRLVQAENAEPRVRFLPFISVNELITLYQQASAMLYISLYEGFGIPLLEAFSCGCPVVASDTTSIPEVAGDAAFYVDPTNSSAIESAIVRLCADTGLQSELRALGFRRAKQFSWEKTATKTLEVYRSLLPR